MLADAAIAPVAALLADPARAAILMALSDGREMSAGELALVAAVTPSTASGWLERMPDCRAVQITAVGRRGFQQRFGMITDS
jgi:DNA-binding transcriptional ArsR family regulator